MIITFFQYLRYYSAIGLFYGVTVVVGIYMINPTATPFRLNTPLAEAATGEITAIQTKAGSRSAVTGQPVRITIQPLAIDLPVDRGVHDPTDGSWTLSDTRAQFALPSHPANTQSGMTLIYGHNNRHVFAPLHRLRAGDQARVYTHNNYLFHYRYQGYEMVTPTNVSIFAYKGKPRLTLQTCSGNWDGLRRLHHFSLVKVEKRT
jgi:LPXTG-site transpeptidase (sortase) family protein